jgi:hypothetical protein
MTNKKYKYDVAFSFLQEDEDIAIKLSDLLKGRFTTFIYSENQAELAGKDGEKIFNSVFGKECRIAVVLFRNNWGKTKWTRIEMTAIKNRAFDDGYDFTLFIPLEENAKLPKWLPRTQIWYNYNRWGIDSAASIIEYKIHQEGGIEKVESISDKAARIDREIDFKKKKEAFLDSADGVQAAHREFAILFDEIEKIIKDICENNQHFNIGFDRDGGGHQVTLLYNAYSLIVYWSGNVINSLSTSYLYIVLWKRLSKFDPYEKRDKVFEHEVKFNMLESNEFGWYLERDEKTYSSKRLAELIVSIILEKISH